MNGHPGGSEHTMHMLERSGLKPPARVLDMGAGGGETVRLLRHLGFDARGIDLSPAGAGVDMGDFLQTAYPDEDFDAVISQCAFFVSGDARAALNECRRLLKPGGLLMLSDVCRSPLDAQVKAAGFSVLCLEDMTAVWKDYYIEAIWRGTAECVPFKGSAAYQMLICAKEKNNGPA